MNDIPRTLGGRLKKARESKGLFQRDVADFVGITQSTVNRYETDGVKAPQIKHLELFAKFYGTTVEELTSNPYSLDHIPEELMEMLYDKGSLPFLAEAYGKFMEYKVRKEIENKTKSGN